MYGAAEELGAAAKDYRWLLDRGYPESASLKIVGDRHQLGRDERIVLFRGVSARAPSQKRESLRTPDPRGRRLLIDAYNEIFTVMHYLMGRPVFIASDGLVRDAGASHGRISRPESFARSIEILAASLAPLGLLEITAWFDAPVPHSGDHGRAFQAALDARGLPGRVFVERSADAPLKMASEGEVVATSDSAIVDFLAERRGGCTGRVLVFDAARAALEAAFGHLDWLDFRAILAA